MKVILILAAGKGKRMLPLTKDTPKPFLPWRGKRIVEWILERVAGLGEPVLVVSDPRWAREIGIDYVVQENPLGTAHAVYCARELIGDRFLVHYGDVLVDRSCLEELVREPGICGYFVTNLASYGALIIRKNLVVDIQEKSVQGPGFAFAGVGYFDRNLLDACEEIVEKGLLSPRGEYELTDAIRQILPLRFVRANEFLHFTIPTDLKKK